MRFERGGSNVYGERNEKKSGVSVRTLHHYDSIGLLKPSEYTQSGYRMYDEASLMRLHSILTFRQLQFSLKEIKGDKAYT